MLTTRKKRNIIITSSLLLVLLLILLQNTQNSFANGDNNDLTIENLEFQFIEYSKDKNTINNISSIAIKLPSSSWNITDFKLNFTNIEYYYREIKDIEDSYNKEDKFLSKGGLKGLGMQIKLNDNTTTLFGVYMNIKTSGVHSFDDINVTIRGYDSSINAPNSSLYGVVKLNHTIDDGWNYQNFSNPITLHKGNYSLVLEGTIQASANYFWYYNDSNPKNPDLHSSVNSGSGWQIGVQGAPFLYKLDQEVKGSNFFPENYNMTAEIGGIKHKVLNGVKSDVGILNLPGIEISPDNKNFFIPVNDNKSTKLYFDLDYDISLKNHLSADGSLNIKQNLNEWSIFPQINRTGANYTVKFIYSETWENFTIFRNQEEIEVNTEYINNEDERTIHILNDTIPEGGNIPWEITANSLKFDPILKIQKLEYSIGEEILIEVLSPLNGRYTFVLYALGIEKYRDEKFFPYETIKFSYNLTSTAISGNWTAYIYWNNETDAGIQSQEFKIFGVSPLIINGGGGGSGSSGSENSELVPLLGLFITMALVVGAGGSLTAYKTVKSVKKKRNAHLDTLYNKFKDNLSLNYLMISDNKSGLNVYEQFFAGKSLDPSLLSGFLEAIRNFGIELTGSYQKSETVKLEYQDSKILMNESEDFRLILIMSDNPSKAFINSITNLAKEIEKLYGHSLKNFRGGDITMFSGIRELIEKHLNVTFTYPLRIVEGKGLKLTRAEKLIIQRARVIMKQTNLNYFYTTFLMPNQEYDPMKTKIIFNLIDKGIFQPIDLSVEKNNHKLKYT